MNKSKVLLLVVVVGVASGAWTVGCSSEDELASFDVLVCELDALCTAGECSVEDEAVETVPIFARAVESREASRFGEDGLFVLATWEEGEHWVELELDVPTNWVGYVDMNLRYGEYIDGSATFEGESFKGRIALVVPSDGGPPFAGHIELRVESAAGEVRRLHQGYLLPDDDEGLHDEGPPAREIDWEADGVELMIIRSTSSSSTYEPPREVAYGYDYRVDDQVVLELIVDACATTTEASCDSTTSGGGTYDDYGGDSYYVEADEGGCASEDYDSSGCSDDGSSSGDEYEADSGCSSGSEESLCQGDSTDDVWDDDSEASGCDCSSETYSGDEYSDSSCSGEDFSCDVEDTSSSKGSGCQCEGDTYLAAVSARRRRDLLARARGRASPPLRRAVGFLPIAVAIASMSLMRRPRRRDDESV